MKQIEEKDEALLAEKKEGSVWATEKGGVFWALLVLRGLIHNDHNDHMDYIDLSLIYTQFSLYDHIEQWECDTHKSACHWGSWGSFLGS